jgi:tetratricopeptide (TPR) repeat protein
MNLEKLKETARKFEQKEDWRKAIDVYLKAIHQAEEGAETAPDLSLYNRIGDLYLKTNDTAAAVRSYERAVDLYADQGFFNNAIALCGKILRVNPGRTQTFLKLAQLHARKNVVIEAKRNLIEFLERMNALGQLDQAFQSVKAFADQFSGSQEIRMMLVELLRAASREDEAREQLEKLAGELEAVGDAAGARRTRERLQAIDPGDAEPARPAEAAPPRAGDLVFLDTGFSPAPPAAPAAPAAVSTPMGLEPTAMPAVEEELAVPLAGLETAHDSDLPQPDLSDAVPSLGALTIERTEAADVDFGGARLEGMEGTPLDLSDELDLAISETGSGAELDVVDLAPELDSVESMELELATDDAMELAAGGELELLDTGVAEEPPAVELTSLEDRVLDDPDNPDLHRDLADALFTADQPERALDELALALAGYEARENWAGASGIVDRFIAVYPDSVRHHQKRVELAYHSGDRAPLIAAYLGLGDALARTGAIEKSVAVFRRVQEHDPGNVRAATALAVLVQEPTADVATDAEGGTPAEEPAGVPVRPAVPGGASPAAPPAPARSTSPPVSTVPPIPTVPPVTAPPTSDGGFVDLGALVLDPEAPADTRMRVDRAEPAGDDEQREFQEILEQFKRGIEANLGPEDYDAHYDLGVAFKEMGLLDEAVAEFQKAVRAPSVGARLRASEALGVAFHEKGQYPVAETVLRRALEGLDAGDEARIGLIYWLGRALEAQGKEMEAIANYERALAVDIRFMDLGERVNRLAAERKR